MTESIIISRLEGREILDSRGRPTVEATCVLDGGATGIVSVPSGMSTGSAEAHELRDGDPDRYAGLGCRRAAAGIGQEIGDHLRGRSLRGQGDLDHALVTLDGTATLKRLGGNATTAVSLAFARADAARRQLPLYRHLGELVGEDVRALPRPTINLFSGGLHAGGQVAIQDVLVVPLTPSSIDGCLSMMSAVYQAAAEQVHARYGVRALTADEGGLAPPFPDTQAALDEAVTAIEAAGFVPGRDAALAIDVAATHFHSDDGYRLDGAVLDSLAMIDLLDHWVTRHPIVSIEDGLADEDWEHWRALRARLGQKALVLGDDLLCTNAARVRRAVDADAANALLLKVNQVGTLTAAAEANRAARDGGWQVTVSARSGETEDSWLADLAVGWGGDQIKVGSIRQSDRLSKYNRLLQIESETGLPVAHWPVRHD
jgi:enolase